MNPTSRPPGSVRNGNAGFTLTELAVVIVSISILAVLALPAFSQIASGTQGNACLANVKALELCWQLYANDNNDRVVGAGNWVGASMSGLVVSPSMTNAEALRVGRLWKYNESFQIYQDPAEPLWPPGQQVQVKRIRSYSLDTFSAGANVQGKGPQGQPLAYAPFTKVSQARFPGPARRLGFIDENESSIDDGLFALEVGGNDPIQTAVRWRNEPSARHDCGTVVGFWDGHSELWKFVEIEQQPNLCTGVFRPGMAGNVTIGSNGGVIGQPGSGNGFPVWHSPKGEADRDLIRISGWILDKLGWDVANGWVPLPL